MKKLFLIEGVVWLAIVLAFALAFLNHSQECAFLVSFIVALLLLFFAPWIFPLFLETFSGAIVAASLAISTGFLASVSPASFWPTFLFITAIDSIIFVFSFGLILIPYIKKETNLKEFTLISSFLAEMGLTLLCFAYLV